MGSELVVWSGNETETRPAGLQGDTIQLSDLDYFCKVGLNSQIVMETEVFSFVVLTTFIET